MSMLIYTPNSRTEFDQFILAQMSTHIRILWFVESKISDGSQTEN
jgi:hypothetical protein